MTGQRFPCLKYSVDYAFIRSVETNEYSIFVQIKRIDENICTNQTLASERTSLLTHYHCIQGNIFNSGNIYAVFTVYVFI